MSLLSGNSRGEFLTTLISSLITGSVLHSPTQTYFESSQENFTISTSVFFEDTLDFLNGISGSN